MILKNNKGVTLIELMVSTAIVSVAMTGAISLLFITSGYSTSFGEEFRALSNSYRMEYELRKYVSLAVRVVPNTTRTADWQGSFINQNCELINDCPDWFEFAYFNRENSTGGLGADPKDEDGVAPTWLWYKGPHHDPANHLNSHSGILVIVKDDDNGGAPEVSDSYFDQLTSFEVEPQGSGAANSVARLSFTAGFRYHGVTKVRSWCHYTDLNGGSCDYDSGEVPNFLDLEHKFNITLVNNLTQNKVGDGSGLEVRPVGLVHFFNDN